MPTTDPRNPRRTGPRGTGSSTSRRGGRGSSRTTSSGRGVGAALTRLPRRVATGSNGVALRDKQSIDLGMYKDNAAGEGQGNHFRARERAALEELIAGMSGAATGGLPSLDSILAPYVQAEAAARAAAAAATPQIIAQFAQLRDQIAAGAADTRADGRGVQQQMAADTSQLTRQMQGDQAAAMADLQAQAGGQVANSLAQAAGEENRSHVNNVRASGNEQAQLSQRMNQVAAESATARQTDASATQAEALANNQAQLAALLQQIGLARANAESQYQMQSGAAGADAASQAAQLRYEFAMQGLEADRDAAGSLQEASAAAAQALVESSGSWNEALDKLNVYGSNYAGVRIDPDLVRNMLSQHYRGNATSTLSAVQQFARGLGRLDPDADNSDFMRRLAMLQDQYNARMGVRPQEG